MMEMWHHDLAGEADSYLLTSSYTTAAVNKCELFAALAIMNERDDYAPSLV